MVLIKLSHSAATSSPLLNAGFVFWMLKHLLIFNFTINSL